jgi:hypothetical protein
MLHVILSRVPATEGDASWQAIGVIPDRCVGVRAQRTPRIRGWIVLREHDLGKSRRCGCSLPFSGVWFREEHSVRWKAAVGVSWLGGLVVWWFGGLFSLLARECWVFGCVIALGPGGIERRSRS